MQTPETLEQLLHEQIPLTRAMGVRVAGWDNTGLVLEAPLAPNVNDKGTAFAGSLGALVTLAGWAYLQNQLQEQGLRAQVAVTESSLRYLRPVRRALRARCVAPPPEALAAWVDTLRVEGRARIALEGHVAEEGETAVVFHGEYAAYERENEHER